MKRDNLSRRPPDGGTRPASGRTPWSVAWANPTLCRANPAFGRANPAFGGPCALLMALVILLAAMPVAAQDVGDSSEAGSEAASAAATGDAAAADTASVPNEAADSGTSSGATVPVATGDSAGPGSSADTTTATSTATSLTGTTVDSSAGGAQSAGGQPSVAERLEPSRFQVGVFPNSSGNLDFHMSARLRWSDRFASGFDADYRTYSETFEASAEVPLEGTSNRTETEVSADLFKAVVPLVTSSGAAVSIEPGVHGKYLDHELETYGYRTNTDGSISFFRYRLDSRRLMAGVFAEISTNVSSVIALDARGAAYPYIAILESGEKVYSQVDDPLTFEQVNDAMGYEFTGDLDIDINRMVGASVGALNVQIGYFRQFGQFQSTNRLVLYNYEVTVDTVAPLTRSVFTVGGDIELSFLSRWIDIIPAVGIVYQRTTENFSGVESTIPVWSVGMSARL